jgi:hypothetical protein
MSEYEEMLQAVGDAVIQRSVASFGAVRLSDFQNFTPEKKLEYMKSVTASVASAILTRSPFLRTCIRVWGVEAFIAHLATAVRETAETIEEKTAAHE